MQSGVLDATTAFTALAWISMLQWSINSLPGLALYFGTLTPSAARLARALARAPPPPAPSLTTTVPSPKQPSAQHDDALDGALVVDGARGADDDDEEEDDDDGDGDAARLTYGAVVRARGARLVHGGTRGVSCLAEGKEELSDDAAAPLASSSALDDAVVFEVTFRNDGVSPQELKSSQGAEFDPLFCVSAYRTIFNRFHKMACRDRLRAGSACRNRSQRPSVTHLYVVTPTCPSRFGRVLFERIDVVVVRSLSFTSPRWPSLFVRFGCVLRNSVVFCLR